MSVKKSDTLDLMEKHHGNEKVVDGIVKQKERDDSTWRPHPDCPEEPEANLYLCLRFERRRKEHEESTEKGLQLSSQLGSQATKNIMGLFPQGVSTASRFAQSSFNGPSATSDEAAQKLKDKEEKRQKERDERTNKKRSRWPNSAKQRALRAQR